MDKSLRAMYREVRDGLRTEQKEAKRYERQAGWRAEAAVRAARQWQKDDAAFPHFVELVALLRAGRFCSMQEIEAHYGRCAAWCRDVVVMRRRLMPLAEWKECLVNARRKRKAGKS